MKKTALPIPSLKTARLLLRAFVLADGPEVRRLAGEWDVARMTKNIPYPYDDELAEDWIAGHHKAFAEARVLALAIERTSDSALVGCVGLVEIEPVASRAALGFWIGKPYWANGYCTEAVREVLRYAFEELGLNRVHATHFARNPASGRVMQKAGMKYEGTQRQHFRRWEQAEDLVLYGILRNEWNAKGSEPAQIAGARA